MMQWALVSTGVAILAASVLVLVIKSTRRKVAALENHVSQLQAMVETAAERLRQEQAANTAAQEARIEANEAKRDIREHADPGDRARSATDKLRGLSGSH